MDLSLTVKSEFDNVYNESLEKALKHYLTPDRLTGTNLYMCEKCQDKVSIMLIEGRSCQRSQIQLTERNLDHPIESIRVGHGNIQQKKS